MKTIISFVLATLCLSVTLAQSPRKKARGTQPAPAARVLSADTIRYSGPTNFCSPATLLLTANNAPTGATFQWQKDGVNLPGQTSISYTATATGSYTVIVTDANGNATTYPALQVNVYQQAVAQFSFAPNNQCGTQPVFFNNQSTGSGLSYTWNFNDPNSGSANTSSATNPSHAFMGTPGTGTQSFNVSLTAFNPGCSNSTTQSVTINQRPGTELGGTGFTTYNGLPYFTQCASTTSTFTFTNQSTTASSNTNYIIKWGDATADYTATSFSAITHTYPVGSYQLQFIVFGQNGCRDTGFYNVFVGNNPAVGLNNPGNTFICSNTSLTFPISGTTNNPPGTIYTIRFNDGSAPVNYNHPAPASVTHLFTIGSCGINSPGFPNSFQASIQASNPCGTSAATVVPIYVSQKGTAVMAIGPRDTVCVSNTVTLTNVSNNGFAVSSSGVCTPGRGVWQISPATGWTLASGTLGNDFGLTDPATWQAGSTSLNVNFTTPGTYTVKLKVGSNALCGGDEVIRTICVNPAPTAAFSLSNTTVCAPATVVATNNSNTPICGSNSYQWTVAYSNTSGCLPATAGWSFANGTSATSINPEFNFTNPGVYTIQLITRSPLGTCVSTPFTQTVTVKTRPQVTINANAAVCQGGSINPSATVNNCYATTAATYAWDFPGGTPASSTSANPGAVQYNTPGTYTISLTVTNECGSTTVTRDVTVNAAPTVSVPAPVTLCAGSTAGPFNFVSSIPTATFAWTNSNPAIGLPAAGSGNIPAFPAQNNTGAPITATITVTPTSGCAGTPQSFTITVNPRPAAPVANGPLSYCLNEPANALSAMGSSGNTLVWYTSPALTGGSQVAPTPNTSAPGTSTWYVTQVNSFNCESPASSLTVTVRPLIANNTISANQAICTGTAPAPLTGTPVSGGSGSYNYQWQVSTDGGANWTNIAGATAAGYAPGVLNADVRYRRVVTSVTCADTSNVVNITVQGTLANIGIDSAQTICAGSAPQPLFGQTPTGGSGTFTYLWESSPNNSTWTTIAGATAADYQPPVLTTTMYYRRRTTSGSCSAFSSSVMITVNPRPVMASIPNAIYCHGLPVTTGFTSTPSANVSYSWTNDNVAIGAPASGTGSSLAFTTSNTAVPKLPVAGNFSITPAYTGGWLTCTGATTNFTITVLPTIAVAPIPDTVVCTGTPIASLVPVHDAASGTGTVHFTWTLSGSGTTLTNGSGPAVPAFNTVNPGSSDLVTTITVTPVYTFNGTSCSGTPDVYTVTVKPGTPAAAGGPDAVLCNQPSYTMQGVLPGGTSGVWTQLNGPAATIVNPAIPTTAINGLVPGSYQFVWTINGFASCPAAKDTVSIRIDPPVVNTIDNTTRTVCATQPVTITGTTPTGGNGVYQYSWEISTDNGSTWTVMAGQNGPSLTFTPTQNALVRRVVASLPCSAVSNPTAIVVQPALANNIINADQSICINTAAALINGSVPSGGNNQYLYQWQISINGGATWTDIGGATAQNYNPGVLTVTTRFRRLVSTSLCFGPQSNVSNVVEIIVRPDARAVFNPTDTVGCPPFQLTPAIINLSPLPAQNGQWAWYANGVPIGNGSTFPGYTIPTANTPATITLIALSPWGCRPDTMSRVFRTYKLPAPSFTVSDTVGCGPLAVLVTNTTGDLSEFNYAWDFGNGQTSTLPQPGTITFLPNPTFGDTTYIIRLSVASPCDTFTVTKSIRVKSKPKALFTPNMSVGCSPATFVFTNTSRGLGNTYTWNFGDGSAPVTTNALGTVSHQYITGVTDTFYVRLVAVNECGSDTLTYAVVVRPNTIYLDFAINGNQQSGCTPHTVRFINNSSGASSFTWNFGDNNTLNTTANIDTVTHTYLVPGTYTVTLFATNGCSDTASTETVIVYPKPSASFTANVYTACLGDSVRFTNNSTGATSYLWYFGDNTTSTATNPVKTYATAGVYTVRLVAYRFNAPGSVCTDTLSQQVNVVASLPGSFAASDTVGSCAPFTITFTNQNTPSVTTVWDFGDGNGGSGNVVTHTYTAAGTYIVKLTTTVPGGCTYITQRTVRVLGPSGSWTHTTGYLCNSNAAQFQVLAQNADSLIYEFGDGQRLATTSNQVTHVYANAGVYFPTVKLKNNAGCVITLPGIDSIRVDKIRAGFRTTQQLSCGLTTVNFIDTSSAFFGKVSARWSFGDNTTGTGFNVSHNYTTSGTYQVQLIVVGHSGCADTITRAVVVSVNAKPTAQIGGDTTVCAGYPITWTSQVQSTDAINLLQWNLSNGASATTPSFTYTFTTPGTYTLRLIVGTVPGCYDTVTKTIRVNASPSITSNADMTICRGTSVQLNTSGLNVVSYQWSPLSGLSCYTCPNPVAAPLVTTPYVVTGLNAFGCPAYDTVNITVIQPLNMTVSPNDSICIGSSTALNASGATSYLWSPATGLSSTTVPNPIASPTVTTTYRVVGYDGFNCFTDTAFVTVAVGQYPTVSLGPDLTLATGTLKPLVSQVTNGPIATWTWSPTTDLSCSNCAVPVANIKKDITYRVTVTNNYGCSASDTIHIKTFCESAQVFIPNAFTPDGDGHNDVLMVRASGIALVKQFRIFNRWGELVFEKGNCPPNNPAFGWDGKVKGVAGPPDVYVYTAEVVCENGSTYTYKGNVTILK